MTYRYYQIRIFNGQKTDIEILKDVSPSLARLKRQKPIRYVKIRGDFGNDVNSVKQGYMR
jgi:hypothetical protein